MTEKDKEILEMMEKFKRLTEREQGFVAGLIDGMHVCLPEKEAKKKN